MEGYFHTIYGWQSEFHAIRYQGTRSSCFRIVYLSVLQHFDIFIDVNIQRYILFYQRALIDIDAGRVGIG